MHGTAGRAEGMRSPLPGTGTAWPRPHRAPADGWGASRGQVCSGAGVEPLGRPRGSNGETGGERGRVQFYPGVEGPREQHGPAGGRKAWGVRGREKERERGGQANTHVHRVIPNEN